MDIKKIVISGGPSTGKTTVIQELERRGFFCIHELVRELTSSEKKNAFEMNKDVFDTNPILSVKDPKKFNRMLLDGRVEQYKSVTDTVGDFGANANIPMNADADADASEKTVFFDRGIPDVHAYMNCFGQAYDTDFERPAFDYRYDRILLMPPWREIYTNDGERFESYSESQTIFEALQSTYRDFGYSVTEVPKVSVRERTDFILNLVNAD